MFNGLYEKLKSMKDLTPEKTQRFIEPYIKSFLQKFENTEVEIMITGATGSGKSSTINAIFDINTAIVGHGHISATQEISKYVKNKLTIWDTPGLGEDPIKDEQHAKVIVKKLKEFKENRRVISLILIIVDGSHRDKSTLYKLVNEVIIPHIDVSQQKIIIGINQADMALKGNFWDTKKNKPMPELKKYLDHEFIEIIQEKIKTATGIEIKPIYYSAGNKKSDKKPYNLAKLFDLITNNIPNNQFIPLSKEKSKKKENFDTNDEQTEVYNEKRNKRIKEIIEEEIIKEPSGPKPEEPKGLLAWILSAGVSLVAAAFGGS